jgi:acetyl esterase/lipase
VYRFSRVRPYGEHGERNLLDLMRPAGSPGAGRPVLLHMHGGGYATGRKNLSALPLLHRMARAGWVVVTINYRLAPQARWPAPLVDAKRAVAWVRAHVAESAATPPSSRPLAARRVATWPSSSP